MPAHVAATDRRRFQGGRLKAKIMRYGRRIAKAATLGLVASAFVLFAACAGGVPQSEFDAVRQQLAAQEQTAAGLQQRVAAMQKDIADAQQKLSAKPAGLAKEEVEKLANDAADKKLNTVDANLALWGVQPGTAPRMMELAHYFNNLWFAAQEGNWTYAEFEIYRTDETVKAIKLVRPKRATEMDKWMREYVEPLRATVKAKDAQNFIVAYDRTVQGCNECHRDSTGGDISLRGVKVTRPTAPVFSNLDYKGNQ